MVSMWRCAEFDHGRQWRMLKIRIVMGSTMGLELGSIANSGDSNGDLREIIDRYQVFKVPSP
ncbi:hypothetical protein N7494_009536 [Penicillium frequentans]|uniref:Uncharacterized protein n=1 Tax=Penicillium frequentans TaxID=3151616 RepID=A0AAD6GDH1_9EURO|nr:hypothetical protein N7494_009536 [Penicillium glabrum]